MLWMEHLQGGSTGTTTDVVFGAWDTNGGNGVGFLLLSHTGLKQQISDKFLCILHCGGTMGKLAHLKLHCSDES
jgi:hypothetical protein